MMNRIIDFSDKNRFLIFLFVAVAIVLGWNAMRNTKLDAIPDLSDTQVIVYAKWDRSPDIMEDQVSYPITSALLGLPKVKDIRAFSDFGIHLHHLRRRHGPVLGAIADARILELRHSEVAQRRQR
jgi:Cu(I)/Ag(I) efflux system membrane protein CusA/SilA